VPKTALEHMFRRLVAAAALALLVAAPVQGASRRAALPAPPTGLRGFLLRADEPSTDTFPRTPSFAWTPYKGALSYDFELATSKTFDDRSTVWSSESADERLETPVVSVPISLPWVTGKPYGLYAHVRAHTRTAVTPWSRPYGFNMRWKSSPEQIRPDFPGLVRWQPVEGATSYDVWFLDAKKVVSTVTNVADEREYYTFHQDPGWIGQVHWRVRAVRKIYGTLPSGLPIVVYGPWSSVFTSVNPDFGTGALRLTATISDAVSTPAAPQPHGLTPAYVFTGNESLAGVPADLYRVYVSTDRQCVNIVFKGSIVGSPAYAPRITGPIALPGSADGIKTAAAGYAADGSQTGAFTADYAAIVPSEQGASGDSSSSSGSSTGTSPTSIPPEFSATGALVDLWDSGWPTGRFYWTVVPVDAVDNGGSIRYTDAELPQDACAAGRVANFGKTSLPVTTAENGPYVTGLAPSGRLASATAPNPTVYGTPLVAWQPVLGAAGYEVQWSHQRYPWKSVAKPLYTAATSTRIDGLAPGTWYYRVRGLDPYIPGPVKQMAWSSPVQFTVARPKFGVIQGKKTTG
jgi:hypothetical protein